MDAIKTLKSALSTVTGQLSKLKDELTDTDRQIGIINAQIEELRDMPINLEDWGSFLKASIQMQGEKYRPWLEGQLTGSREQNKTPWHSFEGGGVVSIGDYRSGMSVHQDDAYEALCFFFPEVVHERLMTRFRERIGKRWGNEDLPTIEERRKTISVLEAQHVALVEKRNALQAEIGEISTALRS